MGSKKAKKIRMDKHQSMPKKGNLLHSEYEITFDQIKEGYWSKLPSKTREKIENTYDLVFSNPEDAIPELKALLKVHPNVPVLYNYLSAAYSRIGDSENAEALVRENYKRNPNYLFAKVNYAQVCLEKGDLESVPIIFKNKFDLKMLYPHRSKFHITEFVGFAGIMSVYFAKTGEMEAAKLYYKMLKNIAPRDEMTKRVKRILYPPLLLRVLRKLARVAAP